MKKVIFVSNSPTVLDKELGEKIDKFDIVIRCNDFEIEGYEKHVGTKTDIWASCSGGGSQYYHHPIYRITQWMEYHKNKFKPFKEVWTIRENPTDNLFTDNQKELKSFTNNETIYRFLHKKKNKQGKLEYVSNFIKENCNKLNSKSGGTGFLTILNALEIYGNLTIYGNSFFKDKQSISVKKETNLKLGKHYFTMDINRYKGTKREKYFYNQIIREQMGPKGLDYDTETKIIEEYIKQGRIKVLT